MALDRGGVVAQRLGQNRNGGQLREFVKCAEPRGACAEDVTKPVAEVTGVDVAAVGVALGSNPHEHRRQHAARPSVLIPDGGPEVRKQSPRLEEGVLASNATPVG